MNDIMDSDELQIEPNDIVKVLYDIYDVPSGICKQIKGMVQRIEQIDNANFSGAMECLEEIGFAPLNECYGAPYQRISTEYSEDIETIRQALIKAQEKENTVVIDGRTFGKEIIYLKQSIEQYNDKPIFYISRTYGNKYIVPQKQFDDLTNENARYKEVFGIINNKSVDVCKLKAVIMYNGNANDYNKNEEYQQRHLTDEEFDLLKRWIENESKRNIRKS